MSSGHRPRELDALTVILLFVVCVLLLVICYLLFINGLLLFSIYFLLNKETPTAGA